jgi:glycosyltransferase involved in cell wall biosynthesis
VNDQSAAPAALGMILKGYPRISETFISNEILRLEQYGFKVHIISMRRPRESFSHDSVKQVQAPVDYLPSTIRHHLPRLVFHNLMAFARRPKNYLKAARTAAKRFARTKKIATVKHLLQAGYVADRVLPQSGITHLHAHFAHSPTSAAFFTSLLTGLPFSFTAHAKDIYTSDPRQLAEKIDRAAFVVTCTEYNRRYLESIAPPESQTPLYRVYHGIDLALFNASTNGRPPAPPYRILTVARLTAKKGLPTVFRALARLADQGLSFHYVLIGEGDDAAELKALAEELGLGGRMTWLGTRPHHEVIAEYNRAHAFVLGCQIAADGDRDGIPNVLVESMALKTPVVATRVSAIPELVEDGVTGLLAPPRDPEALAGALKRVLTDREFRDRVAAAAQKRVQEGFDNQALSRELARIYHRRTGLGAESEAGP